jgi:hypothetical protein
MAKKIVLVSDLDGSEVTNGGGATLRLSFNDSRRGVYVLDVTGEEPEVKALMEKGRKIGRQGRKAKVS